MRTSIFLFGTFLTSFFNHAQIVIGEEPSANEPVVTKEEKPVRQKKVVETDGTNAIYFVTNWSVTGRTLTENGDLFGAELGKRADERTLNTWSFGMGLRNSFGKHFFWDGGLAFYRNGESYIFRDVDTMFAYQTTYSYIAMPVRVNAFIGNKYKLSAGLGLVPQMFNSYVRESQWETPTKTKYDDTFKTKNGYNSFVLSSVFNIGFSMDFDNGWSLLVSPELRWQLTSSYTKIAPYIHKGYAYGVTFGLIRNL